ncbi:MAG: hypothetical protein KatS3mg050_2685 [Litorilinea sp.]|nr:MAG: hypothetical protein KatS3mg050_2685 [Litorilinea sp.]
MSTESTFQSTEPMPLPPDFNPETLMVAKTTEYGLFHEVRRAARLAADLVAHGTPQDCALAARILEAVLRCQERDPRDPHHGNFYWMREDDHVEDLNAVEFVLEALLPMMIRHEDRLPAEIRSAVREAIRLGLAEIRRLDVLVAYTNIAVLDILNTCLGGEYLGDEALARRGYEKLAAWIAFTNRSGHPMEYNSPTYTAVTLRALKRLTDLVRDEATRQRARAMAARLALSVALHIHAGTGRWAGPHGRAYQPSVVCETPPEVEMLQAWIEDGTVPAWVGQLLAERPAVYQVTETAEASRDLALTTFLTPEFALGTASASFHPQANVCIAHVRRPRSEQDPAGCGVFYTRYLFDEKWFGDAYHPTDRTKTRNLPDEGSFVGVQRRNQALCVYGLAGRSQFHSAKAALIWTRRAALDQIWVDGQEVSTLPVTIPEGATVVVASGDAYVAIHPLSRTALGKEAPARLVERDGDLVLELYNYRGPEKRFWELNWPGAFYKGRPICAFYVEVAPRSAYPEAADFAAAIHAGEFAETLEPAFTYPAEGERRYTVAYRRAGQELGLSVDLMQWRLLSRWTEAGPLGWPMLEGEFVRQAAEGTVEVAGARLSADGGPLWLVSLPESRRWIGGYLGLGPTSLHLATPEGEITRSVDGPDVLVWEAGHPSA